MVQQESHPVTDWNGFYSFICVLTVAILTGASVAVSFGRSCVGQFLEPKRCCTTKNLVPKSPERTAPSTRKANVGSGFFEL